MRIALASAAAIGIGAGILSGDPGAAPVNDLLPPQVSAAFHPNVNLDGADTAAPFSLPYRLMRPIDETPGVRYPVVVFLHGFGERGTDNQRQLLQGGPEFSADAFRRAYPAFFIAPQCPDGVIPGTQTQRAWIHRLAPGGPASIDLQQPATPQLDAVHHLVEELCRDLPIDPDRVYLMGLSMGGYATWELATRHPGFYAAAAPICGAGDPRLAARLVDMPIWAFHGDADNVVPPQRSIEMVDAINEAGGRAILTMYPGEGHGSWVPTFKCQQVWDWLFAQRRAPGAP